MLPVGQSLPVSCPVPKWRNWQTRVVQVHVLARVWGFESLLRHQLFPLDINQLLSNLVARALHQASPVLFGPWSGPRTKTSTSETGADVGWSAVGQYDMGGRHRDLP